MIPTIAHSKLLQTTVMCSAAAESAKTKLWHSSGNPKGGRTPSPLNLRAQNLVMWRIFPQVAVAEDTSPLSRIFSRSSMQRWRMGLGGGGGQAFNPQSFVFFAQCLLRPKKMLGLLIIPALNGLFKTGHVKVRGLGINHTDSSFPPVELVACIRWITQ